MAEGNFVDHESVKETLLAFHDAELPEKERLAIGAHLSSCTECRNTLKRFEMISSAFKRSFPVESSETFVNSVMNRLTNLEEAKTSVVSSWMLPKWLLPILGYGFAFFLMFIAITYREMPVSTETVLLSNIPQSAQWTFEAEPPDMNKLVELS